MLEDAVEAGGEQPGGWEDVRAPLPFEEEGKPEGQVRAVRWTEGGCCSLHSLAMYLAYAGKNWCSDWGV